MNTSDEAASRAEVVEPALERERRRVIAERDIAALQVAGEEDLDGLAEFAANSPLDDLD